MNNFIICPTVVIENDAKKSYEQYLAIISTGSGVGIDSRKADEKTLKEFIQLIHKHSRYTPQ